MDSNPSISNSIIWGNSGDDLRNFSGAYATATYSDIGGAGVYPGTGNINSDPLLVGFLSFFLSEPDTGDAAQIGLGRSPCVNAGSDTAVNIGLDGKTTRTDGVADTGVVDMGFHMWLGPPAP